MTHHTITEALAKELAEARKIIRASLSRNLAKDWDRRATEALAAYRAQEAAPAAAEGRKQAASIDPMQDPMRPGYFMNYAQDETPAEMVLRKLACWLGVGGYNAPTVDAELFHRKIVDGVHALVSTAAAHPQPAPDEQAAGQPEPVRDDFLQGVCVALQHVKSSDSVCWAEIVRAVGIDQMLNYAAHIEPEEWELAGFDQHAEGELHRRKPRKPTRLRYYGADGSIKDGGAA